MQKALLALTVLSCASAIPAQLAVRVTAKTSLTVRAGGDSKTISAGRDLTGGASIRAAYQGRSCSSSAHSWVTVTRPAGGVRIAFNNTASSTGSFSCGASGSFGSHSILATLRAPAPVTGSVVVVIPPYLQSSYYSSSGSVTIGTTSVSAPPRRKIFGQTPLIYETTAEVGPAGLPITITAGGIAHTSAVAMSISVEFRPNGNQVTPIGTACGPTMRASLRNDDGKKDVRAVVTGSVQTPHAFFVLGMRRQDVPVPPTGCRLYTDIVIPVQATVTGGTARFGVRLPDGFSGSFLLQFLAGTTRNGVDHWRTSQAARFRLP